MKNKAFLKLQTKLKARPYLTLITLVLFLAHRSVAFAPRDAHYSVKSRSASAPSKALRNLKQGNIRAHPAFSKTTAMSSAIDTNMEADASTYKFKIRTITAFVKIQSSDFTAKLKGIDKGNNEENSVSKDILEMKIEECAKVVKDLKKKMEDKNYIVQTVRLATNPFAEYLIPSENSSTLQSPEASVLSQVEARLHHLDTILAKNGFEFCSLGPSFQNDHTLDICPLIVRTSPRFSCSANADAGDIGAAEAASTCILKISKLGNDSNESYLQGGIGNFRFCSVSSSRDFIPFFPGARCEGISKGENSLLDCQSIGFALGLENGELAGDLLSDCKSISNIKTLFGEGMMKVLEPIESICDTFEKNSSDFEYSIKYLGIDNSLNPSLSKNGSVAQGIENLIEVQPHFGRQGTLAAAAAITTTLQSLPLKLTGYCGLMLPVCEDQRLSELGSQDELNISQLLCISSVCGVGVDTVPLPGNISGLALQSLILDVAALAGRWNKSLSCRVFPVPDLNLGDETSFDSPHLCNSRVFDV